MIVHVQLGSKYRVPRGSNVVEDAVLKRPRGIHRPTVGVAVHLKQEGAGVGVVTQRCALVTLQVAAIGE